MKMNALGWIAFILVIVGGLNWALVGLFEFDLVASIFGEMSTVARIVYVLVGLGALYLIVAMPGKKASAPVLPQQPTM